MLVDVIMLAWNSDKPYFKHVLESIKREIPIHCFILVDKYSSDKTVQTVRTYFPNAKIILSDNQLAKARQLGIQHVDTEYFVFVDDDIILPNGWFEKLRKNIDSETGAIHALAIPAVRLPYEEKWRKWNEKELGTKKTLENTLEITKQNAHEIRGYTHNTIIKTALCKDWRLPADISVFEDQLLLWHIVNKGYKWKIVQELSAQHYPYENLKEYLRKVRWRTAGGRAIGMLNYSLKQILCDFLISLYIALKASVNLKEPRILPYILLLNFAGIQGYFNWIKYTFLPR
jgi:glycosyltransferase involved in cell wall biosynthesis